MPPLRKSFMPGGGSGMNAAASGAGMETGMPQPGRMNARPPMAMDGGQGQPQPILPMGAPGGGPTSPGNIGAMLQPQGAMQPENADGTDPNARSGPGQSMPMVMLQLMKQLGMLG